MKAFVLMAACAWSVAAAQSLTGRVVSASAAPLADAKVWLKNRPDHVDSTGADGRFNLDLGPTTLQPEAGGQALPAGMSFRNGRLAFTLGRAQAITVELLDLRGAKVQTLFRGRREAGSHVLPLHASRLPAGGAYVLSFRSEDAVFRLPVLSGEPLPGGSASGMAALAKSAAAEDTLIVLRMGHEIRKTAVADGAGKDLGDLALKVRSYRRDTALAVKPGRRIEVYAPSDYAGLYKLPVLYLLHGGGANETYWRQNCKFLDSLNTFADRVKVQPMLIVTPSAGGNQGYGHYGKTADPFYTDLTVDIRNWVESHYKVDTTRRARAISGLSMGAMQTWNLTLFYPRLWGWSLPMSGGLFKSVGFTPAKLRADAASKAVDVEALNQLRLFKVYVNPTDIAFGDTDTTRQWADTLGIRHEIDFATKTAGGHTDPYWNEVFRKYAPVIFKD